MSTTIYYFSGTGNSLHLARELQKRLPDSKLIPMLSLLNREKISAAGEVVGFVYPIYLTAMPAPVRQFFTKFDTASARYFFSGVTRIGTFQVAHTTLRKLLRKQGKKLDCAFTVNMANNSPAGVRPKGNDTWVSDFREEHIQELDARLQRKLDRIVEKIKDRGNYPKRAVPNPFASLLALLMNKIVTGMQAKIPFFADDTCTGCGICEDVCPSGKVRMEEGRPLWLEELGCYYCYACFNFCPHQSVLLRNIYTKKEGRYSHPGVSAKDIAGQKTYAG